MSAVTTKPATALPANPAALPEDGRIGLRDNARHIGALVRRNALKIKQDPESMFDAVLMPIIFTLLFVYVFGGAMTGGNRDAYIDYFIPGMMAMGGIQIAMGVGTGLNEDVNTGVMDRFRSLPIARSSVLIAKVIVEMGRMLVSTLILLTLGFVIGFDVKTGPLELIAAVALALLFGASLTWVFMLIGLSMKTAQAVQGVGFMVLMPLQFGSSIFAQPTTMPGWLESFTDYNPLSLLADAARALTQGHGAVTSPVLGTLAWAVAITAVTAPLAVRKFRDRT
ncbi:ABC transporter permease [Streptomyces sp. XD-27]|uniref:ABC transporter permease n=1 Tax=Streptomyces sp. XD-27 TaxID=3062779 RepID=UPI0026F434B6|nr:ABC transporter permease [Streptomyces sp. XD-27]WKX69993.1 ABC transporter permease [Streptomyces sp. XD-27]